MFSPSPPPPTSPPSPLILTGMAGHRQPIKPGLGGYLHTLGWSDKVSEHAPIPPYSVHKPLFMVPHLSPIPAIVHFIPLAPMFVSSLCLFSFQSAHPVSCPHNRTSRNYSFYQRSSANSQCLLSGSFLYRLDPVLFAVMIMKWVGITKTKLKLEGRDYENLGF